MRRQVVVDRQGRILATAPHPEDHPPSAGARGPRSLGFVPLKGQKVHTVDIPSELSDAEGLSKLHKSYSIRLSGGRPILAKKRK
jgi:hypothetical protein